jgi:hypothetical protein
VPEPSDDERAAILEALRSVEGAPAGSGSEWRRAALHEGTEGEEP